MNFPLLMLVLLILTGSIHLLDKILLRKKRVPGLREPWWVEYSKSFFPVILFVFVLRSFIVEPFKIPSGSMIPTLVVGDYILVNKFTYGLRLPVVNYKLISIGDPVRGDVMVFKYPVDESLDYIKRVVGIPGDVVEYRDKKLIINGELVDTRPVQEQYESKYWGYEEKLGDEFHSIQIRTNTPPVQMGGVRDFPMRENCSYNERGFLCEIPATHYFVMGDNRDSSSDSRYWGFVPEKNLVGKAFFIWWHFDQWSRIGNKIQ